MVASGSNWRGSLESAADRFKHAGKRGCAAAGNYMKGAAPGAATGAAMGALVGAGAVAVQGMGLNALGFTTVGPAAGSYAAAWMSGISSFNGVGVSTGSTYALFQSAAMGGEALVGAPFVIGVCATGAAVGAVVVTTRRYGRGRSGDAPALDDSTKEELSSGQEGAAKGEELSSDQEGAAQGEELSPGPEGAAKGEELSSDQEGATKGDHQ